MDRRELIPAVVVVACAILGALWSVERAPSPSDGPQFQEFCERSEEC